MAVRQTLLLSLAVTLGACGGDSSGPVPPMVLQSLDPPTIPAGSGTLTLGAIGSGFPAGAVIRWNGSDRPTAVVSATRLDATIAAADLASGAEVTVVVRSADASVVTGPQTFTIVNPAPVADSLRTTSLLISGTTLDLVVRGHGFVPTSVGRFNGSDRMTFFGDSTQISVRLTAADMGTAGTFDLSVTNPAPGGGSSGTRTLTLLNPVARPIGMSPTSAAAGGAGFVLTVTGSDFAQGAVVSIDGIERTTNRTSSTELTADLTQADLAVARLAQVRVRNIGPGGGTSIPLLLSVGSPARTDSTIPIATVGLATTYLVSDTATGLVYAAAADYILVFTGATGVLTDSIPVVGTPQRMAISEDGAFLYAAFDQAPMVRRVRLATRTVDVSFDLGTDPIFMHPLIASGLAVVPGSSGSVVIARRNPGISPGERGVGVYDNGAVRGTLALVNVSGEPASTILTASDQPAVFYGFLSSSSAASVRRYTIGAGGVAAGAQRFSLFAAGTGAITFGFGRIFGSDGSVVLAEPGIREGGFATGGWVCVDPQAGRVYVLFAAGGITAYNPVTRDAIGSVTTPSGVNHLVRWAADGLAYRTNSTVVFLRHTLAN